MSTKTSKVRVDLRGLPCGLRTTRQMYEKFSDDDARKLFWTEGHNIDIEKISEFSEGYAMMKFKNVNSDGSPAKANGFVDVDFPVFRYADALLMKAECELRGATGADGLAGYNLVRGRAGQAAGAGFAPVPDCARSAPVYEFERKPPGLL